MNSTLARYAEVTRQMAVERARLGSPIGRPEMSLTLATLAEERVRLAMSLADDQLRATIAKGG